MLLSLTIKNLVLISAARLELGAGLNVFSGETGAGKSILLSAIDLVRGVRAGPDVIMAGQEEAMVEAVFDWSERPDVCEELQAAGLAGDQEWIVRRTIARQGRSRAWINGAQVTLDQLRQFFTSLVDFSSQHSQQALAKSSFHRDLVDAFGAHQEILNAYQKTYSAYEQARKERDAFLADLPHAQERLDFLNFRLEQWDKIKPACDEDQKILRQLNSGKTASEVAEVVRELEAWREGEVASGLWRSAQKRLEFLANSDEHFGRLRDQLQQGLAQIDEVRAELAQMATQDEDGPVDVDKLQERLYQLQKLVRPLGGSLKEAFGQVAQMQQERENLTCAHETQRQLEEKLKLARTQALAAAKELFAARAHAGRKMAESIVRQLRDLGMPRAQVAWFSEWPVELAGMEPARAGVGEGYFVFAANAGQEPKPLWEVASGGEISRLYLAVKSVAATCWQSQIFVFDEIDAGVGGEVAIQVGARIKRLAHHHQVLCVTHLPQIACYADHHAVIHKHEGRKTTQTNIATLAETERLQELARMLAGSAYTKTSLAHAQELLERVRQKQ